MIEIRSRKLLLVKIKGLQYRIPANQWVPVPDHAARYLVELGHPIERRD